MLTLRPAAFLDRDGVLNDVALVDGVGRPPRGAGELQVLPGVREACERLKACGFVLVVVTNQPDVARGSLSPEMVDSVNEALRLALPLDAIYVCPHDDDAGCDCRKPLPGMLLAAAQDLGLDLGRSVMVGDRWRDIEAGRRAGVATVLIRNRQPANGAVHPDLEVSSLASAVDWMRDVAQRPGPVTARDLKIKLFADGADIDRLVEVAANPMIKGLTTNPTLMRKAGITDYEAFARELIERLPDHPISFEVFADEFTEMERQARRIARGGENVYVKIPVTNTRAESSVELVRELARQGIRQNVTALLTLEQVSEVSAALSGGPHSFVSVFAGRIADTGRDPVPIMSQALSLMATEPSQELIWASPREVLNIAQADAIGCHIITVTLDLLAKLPLLGRDLGDYSLDTVRMFHRDAQAAGFSL